MKRLLIILFLIAAIPAPACTAAENRYTVPIEDSPSMGAEGAPVTIIEFLDYQ